MADFIGTEHYGFRFTVQEGIDAVSDVIYHLETYDITTIRAGTPMFLLSRKVKAMGIKMVMSGEGADETLAGYLYFHKARETRPLSARSAFPLSHRPKSRPRSPPTRRRTASSCTRSACARWDVPGMLAHARTCMYRCASSHVYGACVACMPR